MATTLTTQKGKFRLKLYQSLNDDPTLIDEIRCGTPAEVKA